MSNFAAVQPNDPAWLKGAFGDLGLHESDHRGASNPRVLEMFRTAGHPEIHDDETAWCSAAVNTWMIEAGYAGTRALNARSWLTYGQKLNISGTLKRGTILIFRRGNSSWLGHVCLLLRDQGDTVMVIGGNQSDQVCVRTLSRAALIGAVWPTTATNSRTVQSFFGAGVAESANQGVSSASDAVTQNSDAIADTLGMARDQLSQAAEYIHYAQTGLKIVAALLFAYGMYRLIRSHIWQRAEPVIADGPSIEDDAPAPRRRKRKPLRRRR